MQQRVNILFVDSDANQLQSLRRSLRGQRQQWQLLFAEDIEQALRLMQEQPVDILVSDTRLKGGTGSDLLARARRDHPTTTRLLFTGQTLREPAQEMVHHAHQFIAKPCPLETLVSTLQRVARMMELLHKPALRGMINRLKRLPSLPETYYRLIETLRCENATASTIGRVVEQDIAMSTKVLQMVNSAFFGLRQPIASPTHAVSLLGIETITNLALAAGVFEQIKPALLESFDLQALWRHSLNVAGLTQALCVHLELDRGACEVAMLAGLLHDLGQLVMASTDTGDYQRIVAQAEQEGLPLHLVEEQVLQTDHAAVGAYLMGLWGLPFEAVEAVALHHKPGQLPAGRSLCLAVYAANQLIHNLSDSAHSAHYATAELEHRLGSELYARCVTTAREYLHGETA